MKRFGIFLKEPIALEQFLRSTNEKDIKLIGHISGKFVNEIYFKKEESITFCIGPEGDFTNEELELAKESGFQKISLGDYRLRTETAGIFLASVLANR